jgi:translation initiation factor 1 (eIF-1/SUI1)
MSEPTIKKATKKKFHFPKSAEGAPGEENQAEAVAPTVDAPKKKAAAKKTSKPTAAVESAPVKAAVRAKAKRARKDKVIRDSFTMPKSDYEKIAALKQKCLAAGVSVKKSELLRAGLLMLESAAPKRLLAAVSAVEQVKTGRPAQS